jgi:hypothetical protein
MVNSAIVHLPVTHVLALAICPSPKVNAAGAVIITRTSSGIYALNTPTPEMSSINGPDP